MILYITRKYPPSVGGMQRFNYKLYNNLKNIADIKLIAWGGSQAILPFFVIYAFFLGLWHCLTSPIKCVYVSDGLLSPLGLLLKRLTGKKTGANIHGRDIAFELKIYQMVVPWCLRRLDKVICVSAELKSECQKRGIPENILTVIPNGVDVTDFEVAGNKQKILNHPLLNHLKLEGRPVLITVGRLVRKKGVNEFLRNTFPKLLAARKDITYLIVGDGPLETKIRDIIRTQGYQDNVYMLGRISMDGGILPSLYKIADVFVMPNVPVNDDMEGFGIVALEAGAAGVPVVASKVDGITEAVVDGQNGYLIDHTDYDFFAETILRLIEHPNERIRFGQNAKEFVKSHYAWPKIAEQYQKELTSFN